MGLARRRTGHAAVRVRGRPVRRRPASRHRHRRHGGRRPPLSRNRRRLLHRTAAARGALPDGSDSGRLLDHARASRFDRRDHRNRDRGRRRRGYDRPERRSRVERAVRPPRRSPDRGSERLPGPAVAAPGATGGAHSARGAAASSALRSSDSHAYAISKARHAEGSRERAGLYGLAGPGKSRTAGGVSYAGPIPASTASVDAAAVSAPSADTAAGDLDRAG